MSPTLMKVDFVIIGAQKCGTSSLAYQLSQHPQVCFSFRKEPHYFSRNTNWQASLATYHNLFSPQPGQICGEASTTYTCAPEFIDTHRRLHDYNPNLKLIYIVRNPIERIISHYTHDFSRRRVHRKPEIEVLENPMYIDRTRYGSQIEPYIELFSRQKVLLLIFEEFIRDPHSKLRRLAKFLDISTAGFDGIDMSPQNASDRKLGALGIKAFRSDLSKAWRLVNSTGLRFLAGSGRRLVYRNPRNAPQFSHELKQQLWERLEGDVAKMEEFMNRRLEVLRNGSSGNGDSSFDV